MRPSKASPHLIEGLTAQGLIIPCTSYYRFRLFRNPQRTERAIRSGFESYEYDGHSWFPTCSKPEHPHVPSSTWLCYIAAFGASLETSSASYLFAFTWNYQHWTRVVMPERLTQAPYFSQLASLSSKYPPVPRETEPFMVCRQTFCCAWLPKRDPLSICCNRVAEKGQQVSKEKLQRSLDIVQYLGRDLSSDGIQLSPKRTRPIRESFRLTS